MVAIIPSIIDNSILHKSLLDTTRLKHVLKNSYYDLQIYVLC